MKTSKFLIVAAVFMGICVLVSFFWVAVESFSFFIQLNDSFDFWSVICFLLCLGGFTTAHILASRNIDQDFVNKAINDIESNSTKLP